METQTLLKKQFLIQMKTFDMKNIILFSLFFYFLSLILVLNVYAATSTPSPVEQQIGELKDRIASRVAQLKLVEKRGIIGKVTDISDTQITLTDIKGETRFVDVDELTKFSSTKTNDSIGISDIKKNDTLGVLGLYNKQSRKILARSISIITLPKMIHGFIVNVDADNFILSVSSDNNDQFEVSIETTTKTFFYDKVSGNLVRSGFSKIKEGQKIFVNGQPDKTDNKKISGDRITILPDIVRETKLKPTASPSATIVPSTGSGKKLTPIIKY